jgi:quinol monooxygenase YgiN
MNDPTLANQSSSDLLIYGTVLTTLEDRELFAQKMGEMVTKTRLETGCEFFTLSEDTVEPGRFYFVEGWSSLQALEVHLAKPEFQAELQVLLAMNLKDLKLTRYFVASKVNGLPSS